MAGCAEGADCLDALAPSIRCCECNSTRFSILGLRPCTDSLPHDDYLISADPGSDFKSIVGLSMSLTVYRGQGAPHAHNGTIDPPGGQLGHGPGLPFSLLP